MATEIMEERLLSGEAVSLTCVLLGFSSTDGLLGCVYVRLTNPWIISTLYTLRTSSDYIECTLIGFDGAALKYVCVV